MKRCPLCDKEATSEHHIKPRSEGGGDEPRNKVLLCKSCHDRVEGIAFTPALIESERRKIKGHGATSGETYVFMVHNDYMAFAGIRVEEQFTPFNIILPREQPLTNAQVIMDFKGDSPLATLKAVPKLKQSPARGRPRKTIPFYLAKILDEDISIREKVKLTGLPQTTIHRYIKETRGEYTITPQQS